MSILSTERSRELNNLRQTKQTPEQRTKIAKKAANVRWRMWRKRRPQRGYIYVVDNALGYVKIGRSINVNERLRALNCASPTSLKATYSRLVSDSFAIEAKIHRKLKSYRAQYEWFQVDAAAAVLIVDSLIDEYEKLEPFERSGWRKAR